MACHIQQKAGKVLENSVFLAVVLDCYIFTFWKNENDDVEIEFLTSGCEEFYLLGYIAE
jgi:hypothetical protein